MNLKTSFREFSRITALFRKSSGRQRDAERDWKFLIVGLCVAQVIMVAYTAFVFQKVEQGDLPTAASVENTSPPTIDRETLTSLLDYFEQKTLTHELLRVEPPRAVDPSVRSWYGVDDR